MKENNSTIDFPLEQQQGVRRERPDNAESLPTSYSDAGSSMSAPEISKYYISGLQTITEFGEFQLTPETSGISFSEVAFKPWKTLADFHSRLVKTFDQTVRLELLVDKENKIYQERDFLKEQFEDYDLTEGNLFLVRYSIRGNDTKCTIKNDARLVNSEYFPKSNFSERFKNGKLFKKK